MTLRRLAPVLMALGVGAIGCASDPQPEDEAVGDVSSALPLAAVSMNGANFAGLGIGSTAGAVGAGAGLGAGLGAIGGTVGTTATVGGTPIGFGATLGTGPLSFGTSFNSGPMGFSTGPIGFGTSFGTGPITTGGSMSVSSANGAMPVIQSSCLGMACP